MAFTIFTDQQWDELSYSPESCRVLLPKDPFMVFTNRPAQYLITGTIASSFCMYVCMHKEILTLLFFPNILDKKKTRSLILLTRKIS